MERYEMGAMVSWFGNGFVIGGEVAGSESVCAA